MRYRSLALIAFLLPATAGYAQSADPMPRKMAVIDFDYAVLNNLDGIKAKNALDVRLKYWQDQADAESAKRKPLSDKVADSKTSETEKRALQAQISEIDIRLMRLREDAQKDLEAKRSELFAGVADQVKGTLKSYGEEQRLAVVLNDSGAADGPVLFRTGVADITSEIIRRVNAEIEKRPAGKTPAPAKN
ncbi:MAG TPA: OmpH family outer membrane protein [Terriglobia bacterium]|nr:OmpH family outer membrane protein [Terriglobia bacterium]